MHCNSRQVSRTSVGSQEFCVGNHIGPCTQRSDDLICSAVIPLVRRSAGLSAEGQYSQHREMARISSTLQLTNGCSGLWLDIQWITIWLSDQSWVVQSRLKDVLMKELSFAASTAAFSSSLGRVSCLSGAALDLDITRDGKPWSCWM